VRRREFIAGLGGAAAWPVIVRGQHAAVPVIGFLSSLTAGDRESILTPFYRGLNQAGYFEGSN
jgi:hypothetical protein